MPLFHDKLEYVSVVIVVGKYLQTLKITLAFSQLQQINTFSFMRCSLTQNLKSNLFI